jgi:CheY-like chemotaxis protein
VSDEHTILALIADLFFAARVRETAKQLGLPCEIVKDVPTFLTRAAALQPALIIVDMNLRTGDASDAVRALRADAATRALPVVGYLHDVQEALMDAAAAVGCDLVLSRGRLTRKLPDLLSGKIAVRGG